MGLKDIDFDSALRRLADRKIEEAIREGKFSNLQGQGKPLDLEPMPADENARLRWWALRLLKQNDVTPDEIRWRKRIDGLKDELARATTEARVAVLVSAINGIVHQLNTMGTNALQSGVAPVHLEVELARLRERQGAGQVPAAVALAPPMPVLPVTQVHRAMPPPIPTARPAPPAERIRHCPNPGCKSRNPLSAKFCRHCGEAL